MSSISEFRKGHRVVIERGVQGNYLTADFPGWGSPDYADHLRPVSEVAGMGGVVTSVNSHGSFPYTRYTIRLDNGGRIIDALPGEFIWA